GDGACDIAPHFSVLPRAHKESRRTRGYGGFLLIYSKASVGFPPMLLAPAHGLVAIMVPGIVVGGVLTAPGSGFLGVTPGMPVMGAIPIAVVIAEGYTAAADRDGDIVSHRRLPDESRAAEQAERDEC